MNISVDYKLAKALKEKGYNEPCKYAIYGYDLNHTKIIEISYLQRNSELLESVYSAPIIADVVMWLYEKYDTWISLIPDSSSGHQLLMRKMSVHLFKYRNGLNVQIETLRNINRDIIYFLSPTEAYEAAIKYCLEKII